MVSSGECDPTDERAYESEEFCDACLTDTGKDQARALAAKVAAFDPPIDLVVVSAMRRTMHTALGASSDIDAPFVILDEIKEGMTYGLHPCNRRSTKTELQREFADFHQLDFSQLPEHDPHWWPKLVLEEEGHLKDRLEIFLHWLEQRPEENVLIVTHCVVLFNLLNGVLACDSLSDCDREWFSPGELRSFLLQFQGAPEPRL
jgi:broad specificity phosphatase PhoE